MCIGESNIQASRKVVFLFIPVMIFESKSTAIQTFCAPCKYLNKEILTYLRLNS